MIWVRALVGSAALVIASSTAVAFQEQQQTTPKAAENVPAAAAPLSVPLTPDAASGAKGTPVRIPGLGTLGVIPKIDFGLELLYGAAESPPKNIESGKPPEDNNAVMLRGSIPIKPKW